MRPVRLYKGRKLFLKRANPFHPFCGWWDDRFFFDFQALKKFVQTTCGVANTKVLLTVGLGFVQKLRLVFCQIEALSCFVCASVSRQAVP
jgi:hypothetical protein